MRKSGAAPDREKPVRGELLNVKQAIKRAGVSRGWLYDRMKEGTLHFPWFLKAGGKRQIDSADIDDWLRGCKIPAGAMPWEGGQ